MHLRTGRKELTIARERQRNRRNLGPAYERLWQAFTVSNVGDGIRITAIPLLAASITSEPYAIAAVVALAWLPWFIVSLYAGVIVDRVSRVRIAIAAQLSRLVIVCAFLGVLAFMPSATLPALALTAFLLGVLEVFADTTFQSIVPNIVGDDELESAFGRITVSESVSNVLIGPAVGALLFAAVHWLPFAVDALTFGVSYVLLMRLKGHIGSSPPQRSDAKGSVWNDVKEGLVFLTRHRLLRSMAVWVAVLNLSMNGADALLVLIARDRMSLTEIGFGVLIAAAGVGGIAGGAVGPRIVDRLGRTSSMLLGASIVAVSVFGMGLVRDLWVGLILQFSIGFSAVLFTLVGRAIRHAATPDELRGRVTAAYRMLGYGAIPVGAIAAGAIGSTFSPSTAYVVAGGVMALSIVVFALRGVPNYRKWLESSLDQNGDAR